MKSPGYEGEEIATGVAHRQTHYQPPRARHHERGDAEQPQPNRAHLGLLQFRADQGRPADVLSGSISPATFWAMVTPAGGEVLGVDW